MLGAHLAGLAWRLSRHRCCGRQQPLLHTLAPSALATATATTPATATAMTAADSCLGPLLHCLQLTRGMTQQHAGQQQQRGQHPGSQQREQRLGSQQQIAGQEQQIPGQEQQIPGHQQHSFGQQQQQQPTSHDKAWAAASPPAQQRLRGAHLACGSALEAAHPLAPPAAVAAAAAREVAAAAGKGGSAWWDLEPQQQQQQQGAVAGTAVAAEGGGEQAWWVELLRQAAKHRGGGKPPLLQAHEVERLLQHALQPGVLRQLDVRLLSDLMWAVGNLQARGHAGRYSALWGRCAEVMDAAAERLRRSAAQAPGGRGSDAHETRDSNARGSGGEGGGEGRGGGGGGSLASVRPSWLIGVLEGCSQMRYLPPSQPFQDDLAAALRCIAASAAFPPVHHDHYHHLLAGAAAEGAGTDDYHRHRHPLQHTVPTTAQWSQAVGAFSNLGWCESPDLDVADAFLCQLSGSPDEAQHLSRVLLGMGRLADLRQQQQRRRQQQRGKQRHQQQQPRLQAQLDPELDLQRPGPQQHGLWVQPEPQQERQRRQRRALRRLLSSLHASLPGLTPASAAAALLGACHLARVSGGPSLPLLQARLPRLLRACFPRSMTTPPPDANPTVLCDLLVQLAALGGRKDGGGVAMDRALPRRCVRALVEAYVSRMATSNPAQAVRVLRSLAALVEGGVDVRTTVYAHLPRLLDAVPWVPPAARPQAAAGALWAMAKLADRGMLVGRQLSEGRRLERLVEAAVGEPTVPEAIAANRTGAAGAAAAAGEEEREEEGGAASGGSAQTLCTVVWALGKLSEQRVKPVRNLGEGQLRQLLGALLSRSHDATTQEACNAVWGLAALRLRPDQVQDAAGLLRAACSIKRGRGLKATDASQLLQGLAELRLPLQSGQLPWKLHEVVALAAPLLVGPPTGGGTYRRQPPHFTMLAGSAFAIACALCESLSELAAAGPLVRRLVADAAGQEGAAGSTACRSWVVHTRLAYALLVGDDSVVPLDLLTHLGWGDAPRHQQPMPSSRPMSPYRNSVLEAAQQLQTGPGPCFRPGSVRGPGQITAAGCAMAVDMEAESLDGTRRVLIVADADLSHMAGQPGELVGSVVLRNALLRAMPAEPPAFTGQPALVCVQMADWEALATDQQRRKHLHGLVQDALLHD